jgi:hypothetical protein
MLFVLIMGITFGRLGCAHETQNPGFGDRENFRARAYSTDNIYSITGSSMRFRLGPFEMLKREEEARCEFVRQTRRKQRRTNKQKKGLYF